MNVCDKRPNRHSFLIAGIQGPGISGRMDKLQKCASGVQKKSIALHSLIAKLTKIVRFE